jgi:hypothetical protein
MIIKEPFPDVDTPTDAPPSYEEVSPSAPALQDRKTTPSSPGPSSPSTPLHDQNVARRSATGLKSLSSSLFGLSWAARSNAAQQVHTTVLSLVREIVRKAPCPSHKEILDCCAEECARRGLSLSAILQEKSIEDHTPLYWAIIKRPPETPPPDLSSTANNPDILTLLLTLSIPLTPQTITEMRHACLVASDQALFQRLRLSPAFAPLSGTDEMLLGESGRVELDSVQLRELPGDVGAFEVDLELGMFQRRMGVSGSVGVEFIARGKIYSPPVSSARISRMFRLPNCPGRLWSLTFSIASARSSCHGHVDAQKQGSWLVTLCLLEHSPPTWIDSRLTIPAPSPPPRPHTPTSSPFETSRPEPPAPRSRTSSGSVRSSSSASKPPICIRLQSGSRQLVANTASTSSFERKQGHDRIVASLEDGHIMGRSLQYAYVF